ncbi:UPF0182 family protein [Nocardioides sp. NBC_00163]|uniref:UPF0182 family membrane protein n=1 Tax=unclassified Nocardioides TaxID=2615069 RepID=UPI00324D57A5
MSLFDDDDPAQAPARTQSTGRNRWLAISAVSVIVLFFGISAFAAIYTDALWYDAIDFSSVFGTVFWTRTALFVIFFVLMAIMIGLPAALAYRTRPYFHPADDIGGLDRYRDAIAPIRTWLLVGVAGVSGIFAGFSGAGQWRTYLMWRHGHDFDKTDEFFGKDIGFYVFDLPWWHYLVNFALTGLILGTIGAMIVHYVYGGIRLTAQRDRFTRSAQIQLSAMLGMILLVKGLDYWVDRYDLVNGSGPRLDGMTYTDEHAVLPANQILLGIAVICGVLFILNMWRRSWQLPSIAISLFAISVLLIGMIWPAVVQGFQVRPSEQDKEKPYLAANIKATQDAYGIAKDDLEVTEYTSQAEADGASPEQLDETASSLPIVDPAVVHREFEQVQQGRSYYSVHEPLDISTYEVGGKERAVVLGVRELNQAGISDSDRTWTNLHTVYTHSNGVIASYANMRGADDKTESNQMQWAEGDRTGQHDLTSGQGKFQDKVYFGEDSPEYSIVGKAGKGNPVELDYNSEDGETRTTYEGAGGVPIGSNFRQLMYAIQFGSTNFLLSSRVNENSEILYDRSPKERVQKVAPWLTLDDDVYPVVVGGRIQWVVDGYTTTDRYPQAARDSFASMTDDATQTSTGVQTLPTDEINYMRNAVKATVDAYDGTVTLYEWDEADPILQTWEAAFPGTVMPKSSVPKELMEHLRYPEDLYKVQRYQLARYHVSDPDVFFSGNERWAVPEDPNDDNHQQTPYRMFLSDGSEAARWSLTSAFVPYNRPNLAAMMSVDSDATSENYGKIRITTGFPEDTQGPGMVSNEFRTDKAIADEVASFNRSGSAPVWGQVITYPTAKNGLLYVEPIYARRATASTSGYAQLAFVLVSYDGRVGYGTTLNEALEVALTGAAPTPPTASDPDEEPAETNPPPSGDSPGEVGQLLEDARALFAQADEAGKSGDYAERERLIAEAQDKVDQAADLISGG